MISKCVHRIRLEEIENSGGIDGENDETNKCYKCFGYQRTCPDYVDTAHLLQFYQLFKQDKMVTQK